MRPGRAPQRPPRRPHLPAHPPSAEQVLRDHALSSVRRLTGGAVAGSLGMTALVAAGAAASYHATHDVAVPVAAPAAPVVDAASLPDADSLLPPPATPAPLQAPPVAPTRSAAAAAPAVAGSRTPSQAAAAAPRPVAAAPAPPRAPAPTAKPAPPPPPPPPQSTPSPPK